MHEARQIARQEARWEATQKASWEARQAAREEAIWGLTSKSTKAGGRPPIDPPRKAPTHHLQPLLLNKPNL